MERPQKILRTKQPQSTHSSATRYNENDDFSDDSQDNKLSKDRTANSTSKIGLIQTRDLDHPEPSAKNNSNTKSSWYTSPRGLLIIIGVLLLLAIVVVVPTVLGVILTRNPVVISNTTTTTATTSSFTAYWDFDNGVNEFYGVYNGTIINNATFSNNTYFGFGLNILLNSASNQSVVVTTPFLNLAYKSFTIEAWIYGVTLTGDNAIFAQCQCSSCQDQCLYAIIRNYKMYMGFTLDDVVGLTSLSTGTWYHVAYVYDYSIKTQSLYLQGVLDNSRTSAGPYKGQNGSIAIGLSTLSASAFNGYIDNLKVTTRAKSAAEVLADASVVVYFSFDGPTLAQDMGPNQMNGTISNAGAVSGRVGAGLGLSGSVSYIQAYGFYQLGQSHKSFSFSMWVYPYSVTGGILVHKSTLQYSGGTWCQDMMGFTYGGQIAFHINGVNPQIVGPFISALQWTHIAFTYSQTNGQTLYVNGTYYSNTGGTNFYSSSTIDWLTIGYFYTSCTVSPMHGVTYVGALDEIYIYRRELTANDVYTLANP